MGRSGNWSSDRLGPILGTIVERIFTPKESPPIPAPKRKPPSQRPERQLDETARAIARLQEDAKAEKSAESRKGEAGKPTRQIRDSVNGMGQRRVGGKSPETSSKRPKSGGV
jgi:hypothetical protein